MIPYLIPLVSIGEFNFDSEIKHYTNEFKFKIVKQNYELFTTFHYTLDSNITLFVNDGIIESIECDEECLYFGRNLIGITLEEFISITQENFIGEPDIADFEENCDIPQIIYDFKNIGLLIWTKENIVVAIIASSAY